MPIRDDDIQQHSENVPHHDDDHPHIDTDSHNLTSTMSTPIHQQRIIDSHTDTTFSDDSGNGNVRHAQSTTYEETTSIGVSVTVSIPTVPWKTRGTMTKGEPRPMALLLGWIGAEKHQLDKYAQLYRTLGYITVCATAPTKVIFSPFQHTIKQFTISVLRKANAVAATSSSSSAPSQRPRSDKSIDIKAGGGLILHVFSNGGAFCLATIFEDDENEYTKPHHPSSNSLIIEWVRINSSAIIYDSAPCYTHREASAKALAIGVASMLETTDQRIMRVIEQGYMRLTGLFDRVLKYQQQQSERFWTVMKDHRFWCDEMYVFSSTDHMLDVEKLDDLIASRQQQKKKMNNASGGVERFQVLKVKVDDARHVMILKRHARTYIEAVGRAHESVNRWRVEHGLGRWDMVNIYPTTDSPSLSMLSKL